MSIKNRPVRLGQTPTLAQQHRRGGNLRMTKVREIAGHNYRSQASGGLTKVPSENTQSLKNLGRMSLSREMFEKKPDGTRPLEIRCSWFNSKATKETKMTVKFVGIKNRNLKRKILKPFVFEAQWNPRSMTLTLTRVSYQVPGRLPDIQIGRGFFQKTIEAIAVKVGHEVRGHIGLVPMDN